MMNEENATKKPWYREPWPWIIMGSLSVVVIACFVTYFFATSSWDGLVEDDYYKKGLEINKTMARVEKSIALSLEATMDLLPDGTVRVVLKTTDATFAPPNSLTLRIVHSRFPNQDKTVLLQHIEGLIYSGETTPPEKGRWRILLETEEWRLIAETQAPFERVLLNAGNPK